MGVKETIWAFFKDKGLSDEAIAGVMGNIAVESNYNVTALNEKTGAFGLFQWTGGRKDKLYQFAARQHTGINDIDTQLNFAWLEMQGSEKKTLEALQSDKYSTPEEYAIAFEQNYERSGGSLNSKRESKAASAYKEFSGGKQYEYKDKMVDENDRDLGLKWWGDVVRVVVIILLIIVFIVFIYVAFMGFKPPEVLEKAIKLAV